MIEIARRYNVVVRQQTISTAITIGELTAGSSIPCVLLGAFLGQTGVTTSTMGIAEIIRKSAAGTGTASASNAYKQNANDAANTFTHRGVMTAEGTVTDITVSEPFNFLNGWQWRPTPDEYLIVPVSGIIGVRFGAAPTSASWTLTLEVGEIL